MLGFANTATSSSINLTPQLLPSVQTMQQQQEQQQVLVAIESEQQDQQQEQQEQPVTGANSRATTNSTITESDDLTSPDAFGGVEPQFILSALFRMEPEYCVNGKTFWSTYDKSWDKLTSLQKNKTLQFYNKNLINDAARHHLREMARAIIVESVTEQRSRQEITSKHDKTRLLHLRKDPAAAVMWTRALRPLTRLELDDTEGDASMDAWNELAVMFNDYERTSYTNLSIIPDRNPYVATAGMENLSHYTYELNPSMPGRPDRDGGWIRNTYRDLKGKLSICFANFKKSGNQEAENLYDEWLKFTTTMAACDVLVYARCLFDENEMDQLGRALPAAAQRDTGVIDPADTYETRKRKASTQRQERRERVRAERNDGGTAESGGSRSSIRSSISSSSESDRAGRIANVIENGMQQHNELTQRQVTHQMTLEAGKMQINACNVVLQFGTPQEKMEAMEIIKSLMHRSAE